MSSIAEIIDKTGILLGLKKSQSGIYYGLKEGFPVQFLISKDNSSILFIIRTDDMEKEKLINDTIKSSADITKSGLKLKNLSIKDGLVIIDFKKKFLPPEEISNQIIAVLSSLKTIYQVPITKCNYCNFSVNEPSLLNGMVDRICPACIEKFQMEVRQSKEKYENKIMNLPLALIVGIILTIIGAAVWAGLIIATNRMYFLIAALIGFVIGKGMIKSAGKGGLILQILVVGFSVVSVLLGLLFFALYQVLDQNFNNFLSVNWKEFIKIVPQILIAMKEDTIFSFLAGLVGGLSGASVSAKEQFELKIEK